MAKPFEFDEDQNERDDYDRGAPRRSSRNESGSTFADFLTFRRMILPIIIQIIFWIGVVSCIAAGAYQCVNAVGERRTDKTIFVMGLATMIIGPLVVRLYCEMLIIVFRINETLTSIKNLLQRQDRR